MKAELKRVDRLRKGDVFALRGWPYEVVEVMRLRFGGVLFQPENVHLIVKDSDDEDGRLFVAPRDAMVPMRPELPINLCWGTW